MVKTTLLFGDCVEILRGIDIDPETTAMIADPPYGINVKTHYREHGRGQLAECNNFPPIYGDDKPFDPAHLIELGCRSQILFGANNYASKLPDTTGWIVWDKVAGLKSKREVGFNDNSDAELIWTNQDCALRIIHHRWMGTMKDSEHGEARVHPTQKPIALMKKIIAYKKWVPDGIKTILDPYMGSGSTLIAAVELGYDVIGMEISQDYFEIAKTRIENANRQMRLF